MSALLDQLITPSQLAECERIDREMATRNRMPGWLADAPTELQDAIAVRDAKLSITVPDLLSELHDAEAQLATAIQRNDAAMIGRIVLAVRHALANRLACRELYRDPIKLPSAAEAAAMAMVGGTL